MWFFEIFGLLDHLTFFFFGVFYGFFEFLSVFRFFFVLFFWFLDFLKFLEIFCIFFKGFFFFFWIPFKVTKVTTKSYHGYYWTQKIAKKMGQNRIISSFFCPKGKKSLGWRLKPPQELEVGLCSGLYLLVTIKWWRERGKLHSNCHR